MTRALVAADYKCTRLIGFSQTNQWWDDFRNYIANPSAWELLWGGGASIDTWADPNAVEWTNTVFNLVGQPPDRAVLNVSGVYVSDVTYWRTQILAAIQNIKDKYSSVRMILLQSNVTGPNGTQCVAPDGDPAAVDGQVRCTWTNRYIRSAIASVSRGNVREGGYYAVSSCAAFADYIGHLNSGYTLETGQGYASYYNANL